MLRGLFKRLANRLLGSYLELPEKTSLSLTSGFELQEVALKQSLFDKVLGEKSGLKVERAVAKRIKFAPKIGSPSEVILIPRL